MAVVKVGRSDDTKGTNSCVMESVIAENTLFIIGNTLFIGMNYATVYNLDAEIIDICDWTELESIQVYRDFFRRLEHNLSRREDRA